MGKGKGYFSVKVIKKEGFRILHEKVLDFFGRIRNNTLLLRKASPMTSQSITHSALQYSFEKGALQSAPKKDFSQKTADNCVHRFQALQQERISVEDTDFLSQEEPISRWQALRYERGDFI